MTVHNLAARCPSCYRTCTKEEDTDGMQHGEFDTTLIHCAKCKTHFAVKYTIIVELEIFTLEKT